MCVCVCVCVCASALARLQWRDRVLQPHARACIRTETYAPLGKLTLEGLCVIGRVSLGGARGEPEGGVRLLYALLLLRLAQPTTIVAKPVVWQGLGHGRLLALLELPHGRFPGLRVGRDHGQPLDDGRGYDALGRGCPLRDLVLGLLARPLTRVLGPGQRGARRGAAQRAALRAAGARWIPPPRMPGPRHHERGAAGAHRCAQSAAEHRSRAALYGCGGDSARRGVANTRRRRRAQQRNTHAGASETQRLAGARRRQPPRHSARPRFERPPTARAPTPSPAQAPDSPRPAIVDMAKQARGFLAGGLRATNSEPFRIRSPFTAVNPRSQHTRTQKLGRRRARRAGPSRRALRSGVLLTGLSGGVSRGPWPGCRPGPRAAASGALDWRRESRATLSAS